MAYRRWCFTLNNPETLITVDEWATRGVAAAVWQLEIGESGTLHYQGFIKYKRPNRLRYVKETIGFGEPHCEPAEGTDEQCISYCTKADTHVEGPYWYPDEATVRTLKQGSRTDLAALATAVKEGKSLREVSEMDPSTYIRNYRGLASYASLQHPAADRGNMKVLCIHGPPGIGKSHWVYRTLNQPVYSPVITESGTVWFDCYAYEDVVLLDDYTGQLPYAIFNRILDPYPYNAPVKGGFVAACWHYVIVLTNVDPKDWYPPRYGQNRDFVDAVYRRIGYGDWVGKDPFRLYFHFDTREELQAWVDSRQPPSEVPSRAPTPALPSP